MIYDKIIIKIIFYLKLLNKAPSNVMNRKFYIIVIYRFLIRLFISIISFWGLIIWLTKSSFPEILSISMK